MGGIMSWRNSSTGYGSTARLLHWLTALAFFGLFGLGLYITSLSYYDPFYKQGFLLHKSLGVLFFLAAAARVAWAISDRKPPLAASLTRFEHLAATATHGLLYLLTLAIPLTGYLISTADGRGVPVFGLFEIPALLPAADGREEIAGRVHLGLALFAMGLVGMHALAALKHHFFDRDDTLRKMLGRV